MVMKTMNIIWEITIGKLKTASPVLQSTQTTQRVNDKRGTKAQVFNMKKTCQVLE